MAKEKSSEVYQQTLFCCFPLRLGVFIFAVLTFLSSFYWCVAKTAWEYSFRHFVGGYALGSRVLVGFIQVTGIIGSLLGILGTWYVRPSFVQSYGHWQYIRIIALLVVLYIDVPLVLHCENWVNSIEATTKANGWNSLMYDLSLNGQCGSERNKFFILAFLTLSAFAYLIWCNSRYMEFMDYAPKHLFRVPKDLSSGAFYAHSKGERSYLSGQWGKHEHNPLRQGVGPQQSVPGVFSPAPGGSMAV